MRGVGVVAVVEVVVDDVEELASSSPLSTSSRFLRRIRNHSIRYRAHLIIIEREDDYFEILNSYKSLKLVLPRWKIRRVGWGPKEKKKKESKLLGMASSSSSFFFLVLLYLHLHFLHLLLLIFSSS